MADENAPGTSKENAEPTGGAQSSAQVSGPDAARGVEPGQGGEPEQTPDPLRSDASAEGGTRQAPARTPPGHVRRRGVG